MQLRGSTRTVSSIGQANNTSSRCGHEPNGIVTADVLVALVALAGKPVPCYVVARQLGIAADFAYRVACECPELEVYYGIHELWLRERSQTPWPRDLH